MTRPATAALPVPSAPSEGRRSLISFLLFLHMFALTVAVASNELPSRLERNLRNTPLLVPYLKLLAMDLSYAFNLTYGYMDAERGTVQDTTHWFEADVKLPDGSQLVERYPAAGMWFGRFRHFDNLARRAASSMDNTTEESVLPHAIARHLVEARGATSGTIRLMRSDLPTEPFVLPNLTPHAIYEARILRAGERVELFKIESAADTVPAAKPDTPAATPGRSGK
jgi:hypothetical protein